MGEALGERRIGSSQLGAYPERVTDSGPRLGSQVFEPFPAVATGIEIADHAESETSEVLRRPALLKGRAGAPVEGELGQRPGLIVRVVAKQEVSPLRRLIQEAFHQPGRLGAFASDAVLLRQRAGEAA